MADHSFRVFLSFCGAQPPTQSFPTQKLPRTVALLRIIWCLLWMLDWARYWNRCVRYQFMHAYKVSFIFRRRAPRWRVPTKCSLKSRIEAAEIWIQESMPKFAVNTVDKLERPGRLFSNRTMSCNSGPWPWYHVLTNMLQYLAVAVSCSVLQCVPSIYSVSPILIEN